MNMKLKGLAASVAMVLAVGLSAQDASASSCTNGGVTITDIGGTNFNPGLLATACEDFAGNVDSGTVFIDGLNDGTFFFGEFAPNTTWTALGGSSFTADIGVNKGDWTADFSSIMNNIVVALKGGNNSALFLFKDLVPAGQSFKGEFDMTLAGLIAGGSGSGADLSNFNVAGVFIGQVTPVPLPAAGWLLLGGLGGLAALRRRRKAA